MFHGCFIRADESRPRRLCSSAILAKLLPSLCAALSPLSPQQFSPKRKCLLFMQKQSVESVIVHFNHLFADHFSQVRLEGLLYCIDITMRVMHRDKIVCSHSLHKFLHKLCVSSLLVNSQTMRKVHLSNISLAYLKIWAMITEQLLLKWAYKSIKDQKLFKSWHLLAANFNFMCINRFLIEMRKLLAKIHLTKQF